MESNHIEVLQSMKALEQLPIVKRLLKVNKKLAKKNKELRMLVKIITRNMDLLTTRPEIIRTPDPVHIKQEKQWKQGKQGKQEVIIIDDDIQENAANLLREKISISNDDAESKDKCVEEEIVEEESVEEGDDNDEEEDHSLDSDDQELDYGELAQIKGELEEYLEEQEGADGGISPVEEADGGISPVEEADGGEEEEEDEVFEIKIKGKMYYTDDKENGVIYDVDDDGEISVEVGKLTKGKPSFYK
jgi:hypothetical protein